MIHLIGLKHIRSPTFVDQKSIEAAGRRTGMRGWQKHAFRVCLPEEMNRFYEQPPIMCDICNKQAGLKSCEESRATFLGLGKPPKSSGEMFAIKIVKYIVNKGQNNHYWVFCTCMYSY